MADSRIRGRAAKNSTERIRSARSSSDGSNETISMGDWRQPGHSGNRETTEQEDVADDVEASTPMNEEFTDVHRHLQDDHSEMARAQVGMPLPADVERVRDRIRMAYKQNTLKLGLGVASCGTVKSVANVFVNLVMLPGSALNREFRDCAGYGSSRDLERVEHLYGRAAREMASVNLVDLFNVRHSDDLADLCKSIRILVLASVGCGKTMVFLKYAPQQWALGHLWQQFSILVAREFRSPEVQSSRNAVELLGLRKFGAVTVSSELSLDDYIHSHPEKICLILDGFDEVSLKKCSGYLGEVVRGDALEGINLVITSRPSLDVFDLCKENPFNSHIEVIGFQREQIAEYVRKVLPDNLAEELLTVAKNEPQLASMMATPFYASSICELHEANYTLPKCMTDVFEGLVLRALSRWKKHFYTKWENVPREEQELVYEVGSFAMQMLFRRRLVFTKEDLEAYNVSEAAVRLGLLVTCEVTPLDTTPQFRFSHLTLQESLASKFVAACDHITGDVIEWLVQKLGGLTGHLNTFWILLAARLNDEQMEMLMSSLLKSQGKMEEDVEAVTDHFFTSHTKWLEMHEMLMAVLTRSNMEKLARALLKDAVGIGDASNVVANRLPQKADPTNEDYLKELLAQWRRSTLRATSGMLLKALESVAPSFGETCSECLSAQTGIPDFARAQHISSSATAGSIGSMDFTNLKKELVLLVFHCFAERALSLPEKKCVPVDCLNVLLAQQGVNFEDHRLSLSDCRAISAVLVYHNKAVEKLYLERCGIDDQEFMMLSTGLKTCQSLKTVNLDGCDLKASSMDTLCDIIVNCSATLEEFNLCENEVGDEGIGVLHRGLVRCTKLRLLDLGACGLTHACTPVLSDIIIQCTQLRDIDLSGNFRGDNALVELAPSLSSHAIQELRLNSMDLSSECLCALVCILEAQQDHLTVLDLGSNAIGDDDLLCLYPSLYKCSKMVTFYMALNHLSSSSLPVLTDLLRHWPRIQTLALYDQKPPTDHTVPDLHVSRAFTTAVRDCAHLNVLGISHDWVNMEELSTIQLDRSKPLTRDMLTAVKQGLAAGMTRVRRVRFNLCGQYGTGKTSLMDSIKNEKFVDNKPSTLVLNVKPNNLFQRDGILKAEPACTAMHLLGAEFCKAAMQLESERLESQKRTKTGQNAERAQQPSSEHEKNKQEDGDQSNVELTAEMATVLPATSPVSQLSAQPVPEHTQPPTTLPLTSTQISDPHKDPIIDMVTLQKELIDEILADTELMRDIEDDEVITSVWDWGGQSIFSSMQHFLMGEEYVIYILCFSANEDLKKVKPQQYKRLGSTDNNSGMLVPIEVPEDLQNIDHIRHWLTTIHLATMTSLEKPEKYPPVIMVGNFADKLDSSIPLPEHKRTIWLQLKNLCYRSPTFKGMQDDTSGISTQDKDSLFLIDNTRSGSPADTQSPQVAELCHTLRRATSSILDGKKIKKQWLRFEWILKHLNNIKDRPGYTDRQSIAQLAETACDIHHDEELEEMLLFYNRMRLIIYKPTGGKSTKRNDRSANDDIIIYDMLWLIGQINRLIFGPLFMEDSTVDQSSEEDAAAADLRCRLWGKGILVEKLVSLAWKHNKPEVSNKILDVMGAWNLLYECMSNSATSRHARQFFVPSALQKKPNCSVLDAMQENGNASDGDLLFSTSDCPLIIMLQDSGDYIVPDPDTPLPHSCYCQLLVKLMKRWRIKIVQEMKCSLTYNCARIKVPKPALDLDGFQGHVELFIAHYDSSGAILVSLSFIHPANSFEDGFLRLTSSKKVSIAYVCCRVRKTIYKELQDVHGLKTPRLKVFVIPLHPTCRCKLENWTDRRTESSDLGYVPWKVKSEVEAPDNTTGSSGSHGKFHSVYTECELCGEESKADGNVCCWFDSAAIFKLGSPIAKKRQQFEELLRPPGNKVQVPTGMILPRAEPTGEVSFSQPAPCQPLAQYSDPYPQPPCKQRHSPEPHDQRDVRQRGSRPALLEQASHHGGSSHGQFQSDSSLVDSPGHADRQQPDDPPRVLTTETSATRSPAPGSAPAPTSDPAPTSGPAQSLAPDSTRAVSGAKSWISASAVAGVQSQLQVLPPAYGTKQLPAVHILELDKEVGPYLDETHQTDFARWAVNTTDPTKTGVEHNVLRRYMRDHSIALQGCEWDDFLCVLHYLSAQSQGPHLNALCSKLAEICPAHQQRFIDALSNDKFYLR